MRWSRGQRPSSSNSSTAMALLVMPVRTAGFRPAYTEATLAHARTTYAEWKAIGAAVEWLDAEVLANRLGAPGYLGGWQANEGGHINPYALTQGMARVAIGAGARIRARSPVRAIRPDGGRWTIEAGGAVVRAGKILIATNALTGAFWPGLAKTMIPVKLFQTASRPLSDNLRATILSGNQGFSDMRRICAPSTTTVTAGSSVGVGRRSGTAPPRAGEVPPHAASIRASPRLARSPWTNTGRASSASHRIVCRASCVSHLACCSAASIPAVK